MKFAKFLCVPCGVVFIATSDRHHIDYCPKCKKEYVDYEEEYCRRSTQVKMVDEFDPPWFDDEDDYHSALMGWLNDSDERFELHRIKSTFMGKTTILGGTLLVERQRTNSRTEGTGELIRMLQNLNRAKVRYEK